LDLARQSSEQDAVYKLNKCGNETTLFQVVFPTLPVLYVSVKDPGILPKKKIRKEQLELLCIRSLVWPVNLLRSQLKYRWDPSVSFS
jgi:hypothetical protein